MAAGAGDCSAGMLFPNGALPTEPDAGEGTRTMKCFEFGPRGVRAGFPATRSRRRSVEPTQGPAVLLHLGGPHDPEVPPGSVRAGRADDLLWAGWRWQAVGASPAGDSAARADGPVLALVHPMGAEVALSAGVLDRCGWQATRVYELPRGGTITLTKLGMWIVLANEEGRLVARAG